MGIIADRLAGVSGEARIDAGWLTRDDNLDMGYSSASGVRVTTRSALSLTAVWRCVDLLSSAVAQAPKDVVVKVAGRSYPEYRDIPSWLSQPDPRLPQYTANDHFAQVAISLLLNGNAFVHVWPNVEDPKVLTVLDPARVDVLRSPSGIVTWRLRDERGQEAAVYSADEMLHATWILPPGEVRGVSPLEALRRGIGAAVAADEFAARFFGQGASLSFGVEVPGDMTAQQKDDFARQLKRNHAGLGNSHAIGILTRGAKFVPGLAPTPEQAQMLETRKYQVEDICRAFGVPPHMVGSQEAGASSYASAEVFDKQFAERAVLPLAVRIETQYDRIVPVPAALSGAPASAHLKFNLDHLMRMNLLGRYQAYKEGVLGGFIKPSEARGWEDLDPAGPEADRLYMQQQMVPLGDLGSTKATEPLSGQQPAKQSKEG